MDRTLITSGEMDAILAGLRSLDSVSGSARYRLLMDKLAFGKQDLISSDSSILINLSSWYRQSLAPKIHPDSGGRRNTASHTFYLLFAHGGNQPYNRAVSAGIPVVLLVCVGILPDAPGLPAV